MKRPGEHKWTENQEKAWNVFLEENGNVGRKTAMDMAKQSKSDELWMMCKLVSGSMCSVVCVRVLACSPMCRGPSDDVHFHIHRQTIEWLPVWEYQCTKSEKNPDTRRKAGKSERWGKLEMISAETCTSIAMKNCFRCWVDFACERRRQHLFSEIWNQTRRTQIGRQTLLYDEKSNPNNSQTWNQINCKCIKQKNSKVCPNRPSQHPQRLTTIHKSFSNQPSKNDKNKLKPLIKFLQKEMKFDILIPVRKSKNTIAFTSYPCPLPLYPPLSKDKNQISS